MVNGLKFMSEWKDMFSRYTWMLILIIYWKKKNFVLRKDSSSKVYFRVYEDGVFQVLKFHNERRTYAPTINIGLFSLYGELMEQWFTVSGCIPRYEIVNLVVKRKTSSLKCANTIKSIPFVVPDNISISRQIEIWGIEREITKADYGNYAKVL